MLASAWSQGAVAGRWDDERTIPRAGERPVVVAGYRSALRPAKDQRPLSAEAATRRLELERLQSVWSSWSFADVDRLDVVGLESGAKLLRPKVCNG